MPTPSDGVFNVKIVALEAELARHQEALERAQEMVAMLDDRVLDLERRLRSRSGDGDAGTLDAFVAEARPARGGQ